MSELDELRRRLERERRGRLDAERVAERSRRVLLERRRDAELLEALATVANRATDVEEALHDAVACLCDVLDLSVGTASVVRTLGHEPRIAAPGVGWVRDDARFGGFLDALRTDGACGPLAGRVLEERVPVGTTGLREARWPLGPLAETVGLRSAIALPVKVDDRVAAVLELLGERAEELTPELRATLEIAGEQLAHVFSRADERTRLRHAATHDALTGLPNRACFVERAGEALGDGEAPTAVALLDLDRFKEVNDTLGHHEGDRLLVGVAERLSGALRRGDLLARFGGDEFTLLLPEVSTAEDAAAAAERIREALREPMHVGGVLVQVDVSVGFALAPQHGRDVATLVRRADVAMYDAKRSHAGHALYDPRTDPYSPERLGMAAALRRALDRGEIEVHFQPKVSLTTGEVLAVEALARWEGAPGGPVTPGEFVPLAERTGLIQALTSVVLRRALEQASQWWRAGIAAPVAVNVGASSLVDTGFPDAVAARLHDASVPARLLQLEVTEGTMHDDPAQAGRVLGALEAMGVRITVDDFGAGWSSLAQLRRLPVHELKIDRSLVAAMLADERDAAIVRTSIALAHDLGLLAVAEGVEDVGTRAALEAAGCDAAQGHGIRHPGTADEITEWLRERRRIVQADARAAGGRRRGDPGPTAPPAAGER